MVKTQSSDENRENLLLSNGRASSNLVRATNKIIKTMCLVISKTKKEKENMNKYLEKIKQKLSKDISEIHNSIESFIYNVYIKK